MMTSREIAETLRNPLGAYFEDGSPAFLALETMVDTTGLRNVLYALERIAYLKADHIESNWQDGAMAKRWNTIAKQIAKTATNLPSV
jgi:hypothetical protein